MHRSRLPAVIPCLLALAAAAMACDGAPPAGSTVTVLSPIQPAFEAGAPTQAVGGPSEQQLAQTFTLDRDGTLVGVYLPLSCASGQLELEIRSLDGDEPGATVLESASFAADVFIAEVAVFRRFPMSALAVSNGDRLALVLRNPTGSCGLAGGVEGDPYAGGEGFFDARPNPPGWRRLFGEGGSDLPFQIMLEIG